MNKMTTTTTKELIKPQEAIKSKEVINTDDKNQLSLIKNNTSLSRSFKKEKYTSYIDADYSIVEPQQEEKKCTVCCGIVGVIITCLTLAIWPGSLIWYVIMIAQDSPLLNSLLK